MATRDDQIEFIDVAGDGREEIVETIDIGQRSVLQWWPMMIVAGIVVWIALSGDDDGVGFVDDSPSPTVAPISPMTDNDGAVGGTASVRPDPDGLPDLGVQQAGEQWPSPALDRDPPAVRTPGGLGEPIGVLDRTIVYVNTDGDPTVVSLATGAFWEIDVAAVRVHETFAVEDGEVRSLAGADSGLAPATDDSVIFHTYRATDPPGVGTASGELSPPELCVSAESCRRPGQGALRRVVGGVEVERFDADAHRDVAVMLEEWTIGDRWLVGPDGLRVPAPSRLIWVITPLGPSSASSVGVL